MLFCLEATIQNQWLALCLCKYSSYTSPFYLYGSCIFIVTRYHLLLVVLCGIPSFLHLFVCLWKKYHWCELGILWFHYATVNVCCCMYFSFTSISLISLLYLFLQTIYICHCTSVALPFPANTQTKLDYLSPHYWCSDRHPGGFTHPVPYKNLTVQKSL